MAAALAMAWLPPGRSAVAPAAAGLLVCNWPPLQLPLRTQLPWYSHSLWLPFALLCGPTLAALMDPNQLKQQPGAAVLKRIPWFWLMLGGLLLAAATALAEYRLVLLLGGLALLLGGWGLRPGGEQSRRLWAGSALVCFWWLALLALMQGPLWHWELNEQRPVGAAAALARSADPQLPLALWSQSERPSLSWQSQKRLQPLSKLGLSPGPLQLLSPPEAPIPEVAGQQCRQQSSSEDGWSLWLCAPNL